MRWVTRARPKTDRIACPWLIRRFIVRDAEFHYVPADQVLEVAEREAMISYDAPGGRFTHRDRLIGPRPSRSPTRYEPDPRVGRGRRPG